jgi:hypothetical protein
LAKAFKDFKFAKVLAFKAHASWTLRESTTAARIFFPLPKFVKISAATRQKRKGKKEQRKEGSRGQR